jgi:hypothetical protein
MIMLSLNKRTAVDIDGVDGELVECYCVAVFNRMAELNERRFRAATKLQGE